jgi:hypothetical protein
MVMALKTIEDFERIYGKNARLIEQSCDGSKSLTELAKAIDIPIESLLFVTKQMVLEGLLEVQQY